MRRFKQVYVEHDPILKKNGNDELNDVAGEEKVVLVNRHSNGRLKAKRRSWNSADCLFTIVRPTGTLHRMKVF